MLKITNSAIIIHSRQFILILSDSSQIILIQLNQESKKTFLESELSVFWRLWVHSTQIVVVNQKTRPQIGFCVDKHLVRAETNQVVRAYVRILENSEIF